MGVERGGEGWGGTSAELCDPKGGRTGAGLAAHLARRVAAAFDDRKAVEWKEPAGPGSLAWW